MDFGHTFVKEMAEPLFGPRLVSIRQMAARSNLTTGSLYCWRSRGNLKLDWVILDKAVFATEESFLEWMKQRAERKAGKSAKGASCQ